jgi:hypothetical protein
MAVVVVVMNPCSEFESGVLDGFEAMALCKFIFEGFDKARADFSEPLQCLTYYHNL